MGEQVRIEKNNEWLGRKPKYDFLGKIREKERLKCSCISLVLRAGDIRSVSYKGGIWVGHYWRDKCRIFHFSRSLGVIRRLKHMEFEYFGLYSCLCLLCCDVLR